MSNQPPLQGVNLGGWLLLEKWMTYSLFEGTSAVDEYTFMQTEGAADKIEHHRQTFITEEDFKWMAVHNVNAVRIPVGYWVFEGDGPYTATVKYLDWAVKTAKKYNLYVLIDLHGAKGSQNGRDHSGKIGRSDWFKYPEYREHAIKILEKLAIRYKGDQNVWGIELLNEPRLGIFHFKLRKFYQHAYDRIAKVARPGLKIIFHDAFTPRLMSGAIKQKAEHPVIMDIHWYQFTVLFSGLYNLREYFDKVKRRQGLLTRLQKAQPIIIGEWSLVLSAKALSGRTGKHEVIVSKEHADIQFLAYKYAHGWFYWSYKTEGRGNWNFRSLVEDGVITLE